MLEANLDTEILITTLMAVGKTVGVALVGAWLRRSGRWSRRSVEEMSTITSKVFLPCFVVASLAKFVTYKKLGNTVVVMFICLVEAALGGILGIGSCMAMGIPQDLRGSVLMSIVFGNSSAMPLILYEETASLFPGNEAAKVGTLYVLMYSMVNRFLMWTIGIVALEPVPHRGSGSESEEHLAAPKGGGLAKALLNENNLGSVVGLLIALIPMVHETFLDHGPGQWIIETVELCGQAANPMMMFVLGANLAGGDEEPAAEEDSQGSFSDDETASQEAYKAVPLAEDAQRSARMPLHALDVVLPEGRVPKGIYQHKLSHRVAIASALVRMVVTPACAYGLFLLIDAAPMVKWSGKADPILTFVVLLQACVPGAIQLILIADYAKAGPRASKALGELLLWQHIFCPITMSLFIAFFLLFAGVHKDIGSDMDTFPKNEREVETAFAVIRHSVGFHTDGL